MGEATERELNPATRDSIRVDGSSVPSLDRRPDARSAHRLCGLVLAVLASLVLWGAIAAAVWLVGRALT